MNESTLEALVEGSNSDIRLILGQLQMVRLSCKALTYDEVKVHGTLLLGLQTSACCALVSVAVHCAWVLVDCWSLPPPTTPSTPSRVHTSFGAAFICVVMYAGLGAESSVYR